MRSEPSEVGTSGGRVRPKSESRRGPARRSSLRRHALEVLEPRTLLATLSTLPTPAVVVGSQTDITTSSQLIVAGPNTADSGGNDSTPSIAVDKNNPNLLAAVWTRNDPQLAPGPTIITEGAVSNNGGTTWSRIQGFGGGGGAFGPISDPTTTNPVVPFAQSTDTSVAFDRNDNIYILRSDHQGGNAVGALVLDKFNYTNGALTTVFTNKAVYEWVTNDPALTPVLSVDDNVATSTDTDSNGQPYTQTDPTAGNVYVTWASNDTPFTNANGNVFNPNRIKLVVSSDGGNTFSNQVPLNDNGNFLPGREATPQLAVSQGRPADPTLYGAGDTGVPGGQVNVVWDDYNSNSRASTPSDILWNSAVSRGVEEQFSATSGTGISDAIKGTNGAPDTPTITDIPVTVNIADPRFAGVTQVDVSVTLTTPDLADLSLVLVPPVGSGLQPITLFTNQTNSAGTANTGVGITGANLGISSNGTQIGTVFDDNATRPITDRTGTAPYIGHFQPEGGSLNQTYFGALPFVGVNGVNGTWNLEFTDNRSHGAPFVQFLNNASINFTSGLVPGSNTQIINGESAINLPLATGPTTSGQVPSNFVDVFAPGLIIRGSQTAPFPIGSAASGPTGIGPGVVIASDDTLGAYSPHEGRLYVAYAARQNINGNQADNSDIFLMFSDDGGATWNFDNQGNYNDTLFGVPTAIPVNSDLGVNDGFSGANGGTLGRPQFEPDVAVDSTTGTLVMSWYDARNDPSRARVATYVTYSLDGGQTFSPQVFANIPQEATDAITGGTDILGPVPDNESGGNPLTEGTFGFGTRQGLAVYGGLIHPAWSGNVNGGTDAKNLLNVLTAQVKIPAGPRIIQSTQGPVGLPGDTVNNGRAADGSPQASAFLVTFDRPIDPATFTPENVAVTYRDTTPNDTTGGPVPVTSVVPLDLGPFGATQFQINFAPRSGVGTYRYAIVANPSGQLPSDRIRTESFTIVPNPPAQKFSASDDPQPLASPGNTVSSISVNGFSAAQVLQKVTVNVTITAGFNDELALTLVAPDGTQVRLVNRFFTFGSNFTNTTFDDDAAFPIDFGGPPYTGSFQPDQALSTLLGHSLNGTWKLVVNNSFSFNTGQIVNFSVTLRAGTPTSSVTSGNQMDQNADGSHAGYSVPSGPDTLPLIVPGPHVVSSNVPGVAATPDNLVQNATVSSINVVFDRNMQAASFTAGQVLRVIGPAGLVPGPYTVTANPNGNDPNPNFPRTFRVGFPAQGLSGTYVVTLGAGILSENGDAVDNNLNAGVDLLNGTVTGPTTPVIYNAPVPVNGTPILPGTSTVSTLNVPDDIFVQGLTVQLDITEANDPDLSAILVAPDGTQVKLFTNVGTTGTHANFSNTIFDDAATTPIQNGGPPFFGRFNPQQPLSSLNTKAALGTWKLVIDDTNPRGQAGTLNSWSLTFQTGVPNSGLGQAVADQSTVSFRIFSMAPTDPLSGTTWTAVGPTSVGAGLNTAATGSSSGSTFNGYNGRIAAIAVDPIDPSGNIVYIGAASGGVWKTTDFMTTAPGGPTWIPLTNFGPTTGVNLGSIAIFDRNNDPNQSIIIAGTGYGSALYGIGGNTSAGIGFIRSEDGGATWTLLDSTNNNLPLALRDHIFAPHSSVDNTTTPPTVTQVGGDSTFKVIVDPRAEPDGNVIVYAALSGPSGGLWRSLDTGTTWQKMSIDSSEGTQATDVALDLNSATFNAVSNPTGNVNTIYAAFQGAAANVYISPNRGQTLTPMIGQNFDPLIRDPSIAPPKAISVLGAVTPSGNGRVILAKPALIPSTSPNSSTENTLFEGWLYAAVADTSGRLVGLFMTKDSGATWTEVNDATVQSTPVGRALPTNDNLSPAYDVLSSPTYSNADSNMALVVDPSNPNIVYFGGSSDGTNQSGLVRIDTTKIFDSHNLVSYSGSRNDGGLLQINSTGAAAVKDNTKGPASLLSTAPVINPFTTNGYVNLLSDPNLPFTSNATLFVFNTASFTNDGSGVTWLPFDQALLANADDFAPSTNVHSLISYVDPVTGNPRLIIGDDQGIFTGVDLNGTLDPGVGTAVSPTFARNGNLQITQFYYGAAEPSTAAANTVDSLLYGNGQSVGLTASDKAILGDGNLQANSPAPNEGDNDGIGVQTGQQPVPGTASSNPPSYAVYQYNYPGFGGAFTDFFQISTDGGQTFVSRTTGLIQAPNDPQWPTSFLTFGNGSVPFGNFTVNPVNSDEVVISSAAGRLFSTINAGKSWLVIGDPTALDGSYAPAMTFGAPDPTAPGGVGNLNNFIYAGTVNGNIFVTQTGGGTSGLGNAWTKISGGLDGSAVVKIIADPTRGSHDAYAVTLNGVYYNPNTIAAGSTWQNITGAAGISGGAGAGNIFAIQQNAFGDPTLAAQKATYLTSIQADWRYAIPNTTNTGGGPTTHPILYVSAEGGVYRSLDRGQTWTLFPSTTFGAPADGGFLPNVHVSDLTTSLGDIDPTTGRAVAKPGDPNLLVASSFGEGQFAIRLAPVVFPNTTTQPNILSLDRTKPAPTGSQSGTDSSGRPIVTTPVPVIDGFSEQTAFGNVVFISIYDLTNPNAPKLIGGFNPANPATAIAANETTSTGSFSVQVNPASFLTNGVKALGIQATDASGTQGNMAALAINLQAPNLGLPTVPTKPTIGLLFSDDTSGGQDVTRINTPHLVGKTDPNVSVSIFRSVNGTPTGPALGTQAATDANGNFSIAIGLPNGLPDGTYTVQAIATNTFGSSTSAPFSFTVKTQGPTTAPTLNILPADDSGIKGDGITSVRRPRFTGTTDPGVNVQLISVATNTVLATVGSDSSGNYTINLPSNLSNGAIALEARAVDLAGNSSPMSGVFGLVVATVPGDYRNSGSADPALFRRVNPGLAQWFIQGVSPSTGTNYGSGTLDVPIQGDFDGDGRTDLAVYRPSTATWLISESTSGSVSFAFGQPNMDIPVVGDFNGSGRSAVGVYRPTTGQWFIAGATGAAPTFGGLGDIPVPGDYDGVGHAELAVYRPSTGQFFIAGHANPIQVGQPGEVPVPGAYDSITSFAKANNPLSEVTEPAVFDPGSGIYTIDGPNGAYTVQFQPGDVPAPGDYDGIGETEAAVYRPSSGQLIVNVPSNVPNGLGLAPGLKPIALAGSQPADIPVSSPYNYRRLPVAGDYNNQGHADLAVVQRVGPSQLQWFVQGVTSAAGVTFGRGGDIPLQGAFSGNHLADLAVYQPGTGTWIIQGVTPGTGIAFGAPNVDQPAPADYFGNGTADLAVFRPTTGEWFIAGLGAAAGLVGQPGDVPVPADYLGTGQAQLAVFEPSSQGGATWKIEVPGSGNVQTINFGGAGDVAVPGDYDGIGPVGRDEVAVYRPSTGQWFVGGHATALMVNVPGYTPQAGDIPTPGDYDGIGADELAVYRPSTGQFFINGHTAPIAYGAPNLTPVAAPFPFRTPVSAAGTIQAAGAPVIAAAGPDMAASAVALSSKSGAASATSPAAPAASTAAPAAATLAVKPASGKRPNQAAPHKVHLHDVAIGALHASRAARKGHKA